MLGAQGFEQGGIFIVPGDLGISSLIRRTAPFSRLLRKMRGYGGSTLTQILKGPHSVSSYDTQGVWRTYSNLDPHWSTNNIDMQTQLVCLQKEVCDQIAGQYMYLLP
jgi:hypothetical protein